MPRTVKNKLYHDLGFAKVDCHRAKRRGFPEVIFGQSKTPEQIVKIARKLISHNGILLVTRTDKKTFLKLKKFCPKAKFDEKARTIHFVSKRGEIGVEKGRKEKGRKEKGRK